MRTFVVVSACILTLLLAQPASAASFSGTTSTGNMDTWNLPNPTVPPGCGPRSIPDCLSQPCYPFFADRTARLHLVDGGPLDSATLTIVRSDLYWSSPAAVATATQDARVEYRINGCGLPVFTAIVNGVLVDGEVAYEIWIEASDGLSLDSFCITC